MKILILGAAGQVSKMLRQRILDETDHSLVLYARHADQRLSIQDTKRETIISGDFQEYDKLIKAMDEVDFVYLNDMNRSADTLNIVNAMKEAGVNTIVGANILGIYDEVVGEFGKWNARMVGEASTNRSRQAADVLEDSNLSYTILRLTWLYNGEDNENYQISDKGEPFIGAEVSRQAVTRLVMDIIQSPDGYANRSLGVSEPNTDWPKPSFYR